MNCPGVRLPREKKVAMFMTTAASHMHSKMLPTEMVNMYSGYPNILGMCFLQIEFSQA